MTRHEFDVMLRFKAEAGIVPLVQWVRELAETYIFKDKKEGKEMKPVLDKMTQKDFMDFWEYWSVLYKLALDEGEEILPTRKEIVLAIFATQSWIAKKEKEI